MGVYSGLCTMLEVVLVVLLEVIGFSTGAGVTAGAGPTMAGLVEVGAPGVASRPGV